MKHGHEQSAAARKRGRGCRGRKNGAVIDASPDAEMATNTEEDDAKATMDVSALEKSSSGSVTAGSGGCAQDKR